LRFLHSFPTRRSSDLSGYLLKGVCMLFPSFTHHGGADSVTGSCHRLTWAPGESLLVDCGLFQGADAGVDAMAQHQINFALDDLRSEEHTSELQSRENL